MDYETFCINSWTETARQHQLTREEVRSYVSYRGVLDHLEQELQIWQKVISYNDSVQALKEIQEIIDQLWNLTQEEYELSLQFVDSYWFRCKLSALRKVQSMLVAYKDQHDSSSQICYWTDEC